MLGKNWCFTLNNWTEEERQAILNYDCKYVVVGKELGKEGTEHLQGFIVFKDNKRLSACKVVNSRAHWELCKGTAAQNNKYCTKDFDYEERGDMPKSRKEIGADEKARWLDVIRAAIDGTIKDDYPAEYVRYHNAVEKIHAKHKKPEQRVVQTKVYWGSTGVGKSHAANEEAGPDTYRKNPRSVFWQGYQGETNVIIDEFRGGIDIAHLLNWLDKWPCTVEIKGSSTPLMATKFWITSNIAPREWYPEADSETMDALLRRLEVVHYYGTLQ